MQLGEGLCPTSQSIEESQGWNLESGPEAEAAEDAVSWLLRLTVTYFMTTSLHQSSKKKMPHRFTTASAKEIVFSVEIPLRRP